MINRRANKLVEEAITDIIDAEALLNDPRRLYENFLKEMEIFKSLGGNSPEEFREYLEKKQKSNEEVRLRNFENFKQLVNEQRMQSD